MATSLVQRSFAAGEISPALYARTDVVKYATGLKTLKNAYVMRHGGITNRPGTIFLAEVKDSTQNTILIPFIFSLTQSYILEFGDQYMRVIKNDAYVVEASKAITNISQANPAVVTSIAHGYSNGDEIVISGVNGMNEVNGRNFLVQNVTPNTYELQFLGGTNVDSTAYGAYVSGGISQKIYEAVTPYLSADLEELRYTQSADVMTLTHQGYPPNNLSRFADDNWVFSQIDFVPTTGRPTALAAASAGGSGFNYSYTVTAIDPETLEESLRALQAPDTITGITLTGSNPVRILSATHNYNNGEEVYFDSITGTTELNGNHYIVANSVPGVSFDLLDTDSSNFTAYIAFGFSYRTEAYLNNVGDRTSNAHTISWTGVSGVTEYNIYLKENGVFYYLGTARGTSFQDKGANPNTTATPPDPRNPFDNDYPAITGYYQQRKMFGNTPNRPETVFGSRTGQFNNFTTRSPLADDDSVTFTLASGRINNIKSIISLEKLIIFTENGVFRVNGNDAGVLTPFGINPVQVTYVGSNSLQPLIVGNSALYIQARGSVVRDLINDAIEGQKGAELSIMSAHLVDDYQIDSWVYQEIPHSLVWMARNDGTLLCITYVRDQQIVGWSKHEFTGGVVEHLASIPGAEEDLVYMIIKRTINGRTVRYVERFASRKVIDVIDNIFVDSALSYDGRNTTATTMTLTGGTTWSSSETLTLTASSSFFTAADVGNQIQMFDTDGSVIRFTINAYTSGTVVTGKSNRTVPVGLQGVAITEWAKAVDTLGGLWHLEGQDVAIFADRYVEASPLNDAYIVQTVTNGQVTLTKPYAVIHVGIPYVTDVETLDIDTAQGESIATKKMNPSRIVAFMEKSRGGFYGARIPTGANPIEGLQEIKIRNEEEYDEPVDLLTGKADVTIQAEWNKTGKVFIRQIDPVPMTILSIVAEGLFPFKGGN